MSDLSSLITQIRELLPKVTPGPWRHHVPDRGYCIDYIVTDAPEAKDNTRHSDYIAETQNTMGPRGSNCFEHDAAWIALLDPIAVTALLDRIDELERAADPVAWQFRYMSAANEWTSWRECSQSRYDNRQQDAAFRNGRVEFRELFTSPAAAESRLAEARAEALKEAKAAYAAGFNASAEGWNGEHGCDTDTDADFIIMRDGYIRDLSARAALEDKRWEQNDGST